MTVRTSGPFDALLLEREAPGALRAYLLRLLRYRHQGRADDRQVAELDEILDQLQADPRCQLARVFEAYDQAVTTAIAHQGQAGARKDVREIKKDEKAFMERLKGNLHTLQGLVANLDRPGPTNLAMRALRVQQLRKALRELRPYTTSSDPRWPNSGRPDKQLWQKPLHNALQRAGLSVHYEQRLNRLFNL